MIKSSSIRRACALALTLGLAWSGLSSPAGAAPTPDPLPLGDASLPASAGGENDAPRGRSGSQRQAFLLQLTARPTAKVYESAGEGPAGRRAAREQLATVEAAQDRVIDDLPARTPVLYRTHAVLSGVAVTTHAKNLDALEAIPGVAAVYPIAPKTRSLSSSIPLQGGPTAWQTSGTGDGIKVAIIDTGVDYTHADFGGPGTTQAFEDAKLIDDDSWVTPKVTTGFDFVGDAYDGSDPGSVPVRDPNPLDCNGHGTHVAGIAAGQGVTTGGMPYAGLYDQTLDYGNLRIGPGMAPEADVHAYKVFGCEGSTNVVTAAIDRAVDPDGNGNPSDGADVINMSLGSDFGSAYDADAVASNAAVDAGVVVVASAGNGGDVTDIAGSPANAVKAISVANSVDAQSVLDGAEMSIDGTPRSFGVTRAVAYDWAADPDLSGDVVLAPNTNATACEPFTGPEAAAITGKVVLVTWTQEAVECGSALRGANLVAAGAIGVILANSAETFDGGITGDADIPGVLMVKSGGDAIRAALLNSKPVSVTGTSVNSVTQIIPEDVDKVAGSSSRGIRAAGNLKPDIAAVGTSVFSAAVGTGQQGISETGTSMAAPTVAGLAALVAGAHPTWTPEQIKAAIMNTASDLSTGGNGLGDRFAPVRVGAGRIQAQLAVTSDVLAFVADDPGAVSVSFGPVEVSGPMTMTKTVRVHNNGPSPVTFDASFDEHTSVAGVSFSVSAATFTVAAGATEDVMVTFEATSRAALDNSVDPTIGRTSNIGVPRTTVAEASGQLLLKPTSGDPLRVPVYAAPRPVSALTGGAQVAIDPATQKATVAMSGPGLGFGVNGTLDEDPSNDINSIGAAFELAAVSPAAPPCTSPADQLCYTTANERAADIRRVGVTTDGTMAYFAVAVDKAWNTPAGNTEIDLYLDTDRDGDPDYVAYTYRLADTDVLLARLYDLHADREVDLQYLNALSGTVDTAMYDSDVLVMPVLLSKLKGINPGNPRIDYGVYGWSLTAPFPVDAVGVDSSGDLKLSMNTEQAGLQAVDANNQPLYPETRGTTLDVTRNPAVYEANDSKGLLLVHFHNAVGAKTEVLDVTTAAAATTTTLVPDATSVEVNKSVSLAVTVAAATGTPAGQVSVVAAETGATLASGTLDSAGKSTLSFTPTATGSVRMLARYAGDAEHAASASAESVLTVTATPVAPAPTPKQRQTVAVSLPRRVKVSGRTLITPGNTRTNAGQLVATRVSGRTPTGQPKAYRVIRGKNGRVVVRTFGNRNLRLVIVQRASATQAYTAFERRVVYVGGQRRT